jgi:hypothetical protein
LRDQARRGRTILLPAPAHRFCGARGLRQDEAGDERGVVRAWRQRREREKERPVDAPQRQDPGTSAESRVGTGSASILLTKLVESGEVTKAERGCKLPD